MSYTFVKITTFYRDFLKQYYAKNSFVKEQSYAEQYSHLMSQAYGWADFYATHLRSLGVDAYEIVSNAEHLQKAWAKEHGLHVLGRDIVIAQLQEIRPDVVFFQDSFFFGGEWITHLRELVPSIRLIIGWCCTVYSDENIDEFRPFDFMLVCSEHYVADFRRRGLKVFQMHHAFETSLLPRIQENNHYPEKDFTFIGSLIPGSEFHMFRQQLIEHLIESNIDLEIFANLTIIPPLDLFLRCGAYSANLLLKSIGLKNLAHHLPLVKKAYILKEMPRNFKNVSAIQRKAKPPIYGIEMFKALLKSKIGFNVHAEVAGEYAANVRMFEITGVGSCLLTDRKKNMNELFEEDKEVVLFQTMDECKEKLQWLLNHPKERDEIAKRGQTRTLKQHSYAVRAEQLNEIIMTNLRG
jgi:spore maturation protein CgeB